MRKKILVIQTAFIGDAILTLPMIQKLKEKFPDSNIDVVCIPSTKEIFEASPSVNEVIILDKRNKHRSLKGLFSFIKEIRNRKYDSLYSPHRSLRTSLIVLFSDIEDTIGFSNTSLKYVYKNVVEYIPSHHEVRRNLSLIGFDNDDDLWRVQPLLKASEESSKKVKDFLTPLNKEKKIIMVAPGAVWETKKYPDKYFSIIIKYYIDKNYLILLTGGENDKKLCEQLASTSKENVISIAGKFSLAETAEVMKNALVVISNDSAPTHLAVASNVPVLTIYCSTVPEFGFYPYHKKGEFIFLENLYCRPCGIHGFETCPLNHFKCGWDLKPETVINKINELLNGNS